MSQPKEQWKSYYGGNLWCSDGLTRHIPPSLPDTVEERLCVRCGSLIVKVKQEETH